MSTVEDSVSLVEKIAKLEQKAKLLGQQLAAQCQSESVLQEIADNMSLLAITDDMLLAQFQQNMAAFEQFDPNVYEFFSNYQPNRYLVDIVNGFPNILDTQNNSYLYEYPAYLMAHAQIDAFQNAPQSTSAIFDVNEDNPGNFIHSKHLNKVLKVLSERMGEQQPRQETSRLRKDVSSMMVFGVGAGYQLEMLSNYHNITHLYVIEPELDLFYSSLFIADWYSILQKVETRKFHIHLSLGDQKEEFFDGILNQSSHYGRYDISKTYGFIHYQTPAIKELLVEYKQRFYEAIQGWGFFDDSVMSIGHLVTSLEQGVPILKKRSLNQNSLADYPVIIIGNGPSLDDLVDTIKAHQDKAILISCGSALSALYQYGITPDIHCEQERTFPVVEKLSYYCPKSELEKMAFVGPATIHPEIFNQFETKLMALKGQEPSTAMAMETEIGQQNLEVHPYINPTVANTALSVAVGLGFNEIYFAGVDLGHKTDGHHHSSKSLYYGDEGEDLDLYGYKKLSTIPIEGNFGGDFCTEPFFNASRTNIEKLIKLAPEVNYYNLSDGAKIQGCLPCPKEGFEIDKQPLTDKRSLIKQLFDDSTLVDDGTLLNEVIQLTDFEGYEQLCELLIQSSNQEFVNTEQCLAFLKQQTQTLYDTDQCKHEHFYLLLKGSIMHMQAMLIRTLYEAYEEEAAIDDFNQALVHYRAFLVESIAYYREYALKPHYCESDWFTPLTKFEN